MQVLPESSGRKTLVYDPNRRPQDWTGLLSGEQVAAFLSHVQTGHEVDPQGKTVVGTSSCYLFPSVTEAQAFCRQLVQEFPTVQCEVFDKRGRAVDPIGVFVHPSAQRKRDDDPRRAKLLLVGGILVFLASFPLFYWDWSRSGHLIWPSLIAVNCVGVGLRLMFWGGSILLRRRKLARTRVASG